jgi:hypothetical protein
MGINTDLYKFDENNNCIARKCSKCGEFKPLSEMKKSTRPPFYVSSICIECNRLYNRKWLENNPNKQRERCREYRDNNLDKARERSRIWRENNPDKQRENNRIWRENNQERRRELSRKWEHENQYKRSVYRQNRRAMKNALPNDLTSAEWLQIKYERFSGSCAVTSLADIKTDMEHFIPLDIGHGGTIVENVYPMESRLNNSKNASNPFEWIQRADIRERVDLDRWDALVAYLADCNGLTPAEYEDFVNWCFTNPRTVDEVKADGDVTSLELWRQATGAKVAA